jgi:hypothetical protein
MVASGLNTAKLRVTYSNPFSTSNVIAIPTYTSASSGIPTIDVVHFNSTTTFTDFIILGAATGTLTVSFIIQEIG